MPPCDGNSRPFGGATGALALLIVAAGLALRLHWLLTSVDALNPEAAEYTRIAENLITGKGYVGIATEGRELMFPPLLPLLIAGATLLTHSSSVGGQVFAMLGGVLLVLAAYLISWRVYGQRTALIALVLTAIHPILVRLSAAAWVEGVYTALVRPSLLLVLRWLRQPSMRSLAWPGIVVGLAYLTRSPGWPRIEGKKIVNNELGALKLAGMDPCQAGYGVTANLEPTGVRMLPNLDVARASTAQGYGSTLRIALSDGFNNLQEVLRELAVGRYLDAPQIVFREIMGLLRTAQSHKRHSAECLLLLVVAAGLAPLMTQVHGFQQRYYFFVIPCLIIWASKGLADLARWAAERARAVWPDEGRATRLAHALAPLTGPALARSFLSSSSQVWTFGYDSSPRSSSVRKAGEWVVATAGATALMDVDTPLALHGHAQYVPFPCAEAAVLPYARRKGVEYIVQKHWTLDGRPYPASWWATGLPAAAGVEVYADSTPGSELRFFRITSVESAGPSAAQMARRAW